MHEQIYCNLSEKNQMRLTIKMSKETCWMQPKARSFLCLLLKTNKQTKTLYVFNILGLIVFVLTATAKTTEQFIRVHHVNSDRWDIHFHSLPDELL